jgi:hypothetical protein
VTDISPQSWDYRLVAAVVYAVEQRAGGGPGGRRTRWNGRVLEETDPGNLGSAHSDGSLSVSVQHVVDQLRQARDLDRPLTDDEAWRIRDAMDTLTHEAAHLMAPLGDETEPEAYPYDSAAAAFDEGRTEHWTSATSTTSSVMSSKTRGWTKSRPRSWRSPMSTPTPPTRRLSGTSTRSWPSVVG